MSNFVDKAKRICRVAHDGQKDKAGLAYYLHPFSVAEMVNTDEEKAVAYLHDVLEDTDFTVKMLKASGIPSSVIEAVQILTHDPAVPYMDYVAKIKENPLAKTVKIADLKQNLNLNRLNEITGKDIERCRKYLNALEYLIN